MRAQIRRFGMAERHGAVFGKQQRRHGLAHDIASADNDAFLPGNFHAVFRKQAHNARRGAGKEGGLAGINQPDIVRVEAIHILADIYRGKYERFMQMLRQRELDKYAVHAVVAVQKFNGFEQLLLRCVFGQEIFE